MRATLFKLAIILVLVSLIKAATIKVPQAYPTIQEAINASSNGDTILVAPW